MMHVHEDISNLPAFDKPVITMGSFDGVHLGHQKVLNHIVELAHKKGRESIVLTFHPHPRQVLYPRDNNLQLLSSKVEKLKLLQTIGIDHLVFVPFTVDFAQITAMEYIENFLVSKFNPGEIVIGYDHKFGRNRDGNIDTLILKSEEYDFTVSEIPAKQIKDISISSSKIRIALQEGKITEANAASGHPYLLHGRVSHGEKRGSSLGFPTANLQLSNDSKLVPPMGIYAVLVTVDSQRYKGMLYIGNKPTYHDEAETGIEVHILDFSDDLYGSELDIHFIKYLRGDRKFDTSEGLMHQLRIDRADTEKTLHEYSI